MQHDSAELVAGLVELVELVAGEDLAAELVAGLVELVELVAGEDLAADI